MANDRMDLLELLRKATSDGDVAVGRDDEDILAEERAGGGQADRLRSDVHG